MTREVDVIVVGTGAGGAPAALTLARAGASVLMFDRGPRLTTQDFVHDEIRIVRRNFFVPSPDTDPHVLAVKGREAIRTSEGWVSTCVGGGTVHMSGFFYRFQPSDFRVKDVLGSIEGAEIANWPIDYDEMKPYYAQVEREIGVSGPASEGPWAAPRDAPYPLPSVDTHPAARFLEEAAHRIGVTAFTTPRAIISRDYKGRGRCVYCHLCGGFGCEVGAKSSTLDTLIPAAEATGKCEVMARSMVKRVTSDSSGRATGVVYQDSKGEEHEARARVVVVACSTVETVRLLLLSESQRAPGGLSNGEGQLGKHLMFSTLSKAFSSFSFAKDPIRTEVLRDHAPFLGRSVLDYYLPKDKASLPKAGALNFLFTPGGPIFQSENLALRSERGGVVWGPQFKKALREYWLEQKELQCETFGEYLATPGTYVDLDPEVRDQFGLPVARIHIDRHPYDTEVSLYLADKAEQILSEAGADKVWKRNLNGRTMHLPMGGCRMGNDPQASVVDKNCRSHEVKNLYVTDGSVFVSSGGVPPTFTILANSFRVGEHIKKAMQAREL